MKSKVAIVVDDPRWRTVAPDVARLCRRAARSALAAMERDRPFELCILLADDTRVAGLNRQFRGKTGPTNVLSFPAGSSAAGVSDETATPLGDIALAYDTVAREAVRDGKALADHLAHLVVHGVLHLLGHDHVRAADATRMESLETSVLARLGVADPYA